jgi:hypothetical protein
LKSNLAADGFCLNQFYATEAAFLSILMLFNLLAEFQCAAGLSGYRQPASLRVQVFLWGRFWAAPDIARCCICPRPGAVSKSATRCWTNSYTMKSQLRASWTFSPKPQADPRLS